MLASGRSGASTAVRRVRSALAGITASPPGWLRSPPAWALGLLVALLSWQVSFVPPFPGLDGSWTAALYMSAHRGLDFGQQAIFTYGPLGFLHQPVAYYGGLARLAFLYGAALHAGLSISLVWALRRTLGPFAASAVALLALVLLTSFDAPIVLATFWALAALAADAPRRLPLLLATGGAVFAALETLLKLSDGPPVLVVLVLALIGVRAGWRLIATFAAIYGAAVVSLWMLAGQGLGDLPAFASNSWQIASGYSAAMSVDLAPGWQLGLAVCSLALLVLAAAAGAYPDRRSRLAATAVMAVAGFVAFKEGVVRFEANHVVLFLGTATLLWLAIPWSVHRRAAVAGAAVMALGALHAVPPSGAPLDLVANTIRAGRQAGILVDSSRLETQTETGRFRMALTYRLDPATLAALRGRSVSVEPWEVGAAWAYGLDWAPAPVFQDYQAYTRKLDDLNADHFQGPDAPERILRENSDLLEPNYARDAIDGRYAGWNPPRQARVIFCRYRVVHETRYWQVLARGPNRCGAGRPAGTVPAADGEQVAVPVPRPGQLIYVRIEGAEPHGFEQLGGLLFRPRLRHVVLDGGAETYRLVPGTAGDGLMLRSNPRPTVSQPAFERIPQARSIAVTGAGGRLTFRFFRVRLSG